MSRASNTDQFKFLISCIRWSNNGKVNFAEVAAECEIVSKGAAAKRYERMMKAHGILKPNEPPKSYSTNVKSEKTQTAPTLSKKRKAGELNDEAAQDDEESFTGIVKQDPELEMEELHVKEEPENYQDESSEGNMMEYPLSEMGAQGGYGTSSSSFYEANTGSSLYEPTTGGYNTTANGFTNSNVSGHPYDLRAAQFMDFPPYQNHSHLKAPSTSVNANQYQANQVIIGD